MILEYTAHAAAAEVRSLAATAASQTTTVQSGIESHANFAGHSARRTSDALGAHGGRGVRRARARRAGAAAARARAGRARACGGSTRRPPRGSTPEMADRPLSGDLEAARQLLFEDALWMDAERE